MGRFVAVCIFMGLAMGLIAAEAPRLALVIGNADYEGDAALRNPVNDATDVADVLAQVGWSVTSLTTGDRRAMAKAVSQFREDLSAQPGATALFYYAGHGIQIGGENYLIPVHEPVESGDDVVNNSVSISQIQSALSAADAGVNIIILDACRDNPFAKKNTRSFGTTRGLAVAQRAPSVGGSFVMYSTAPGETAQDGTGRNGKERHVHAGSDQVSRARPRDPKHGEARDFGG